MPTGSTTIMTLPLLSTASETFQQSMRLRWNGATGNLEQLWQGSNGSQNWQVVPTVTPDIETQQPK